MDATPIVLLMTWFLILSSLVWPHIQRIILISVTLILCMWDLMIGQHSAPYNKVGLTTKRYTILFNFSKTFLSHKTPEAFFHFCHLIFIHWFMSSSISRFSWMNEPRYLNFLTYGITAPSIATLFATAPSPALNLQCKYSIFDLFNLKPLTSKVSLHHSNLAFTPSLVSSIRTKSRQITYTKVAHLESL